MKYNSLKCILFIFTIIFTACRSDSPDIMESDGMIEKVIVGARIKDVGETRAYQEEGRVMEGYYNLIYKDKNEDLKIGKVEFTNGVGYGHTDGAEELKWSDLAPDEPRGSTYSFYIDNLPDEYGKNILVTLPSGHPFRASMYDSQDGSNDLLWGSAEKVVRSNSISIDLNHVMARFCLRVYFDNDPGIDKLEPKKASISNLFKEANTFDRLSGNLGLNEKPDEEGLVLVDKFEDWKKETDEETNLEYFVSPDFIIPPQEFVSNQRPRLTVTINDENETSYSGLFPLAMNLIDDNGGLTPWMMAFLKGYKLTLTVKISNEPANIQFMPVTVLKWYDKGKKNVSGYQASVTDDKDFLELIEAYNSDKTSEFYRWGYQDNSGKWWFNIFQNITLDVDDFKGKMQENENLPYDFLLHYSVVTLNTGNDEIYLAAQNNGAEKLKKFLSEGEIPEKDGFIPGGTGDNGSSDSEDTEETEEPEEKDETEEDV